MRLEGVNKSAWTAVQPCGEGIAIIGPAGAVDRSGSAQTKSALVTLSVRQMRLFRDGFQALSTASVLSWKYRCRL